MMQNDKELGFGKSECCKATCTSVITEDGKWILRCDACGEHCHTQEEVFKNISHWN